jgi:hypothetical protein
MRRPAASSGRAASAPMAKGESAAPSARPIATSTSLSVRTRPVAAEPNSSA